MRTLERLFGESPFEHVVEHARKIHECVLLIKPVSDAIIAGDSARLLELQHEMCTLEHEADIIKDRARDKMPYRFYLPVRREDLLNLIRELDKIGDVAQDFAVVATFRNIKMSELLLNAFLQLVDKIVEVSETLLSLTEQLALLQKHSFEGPGAKRILDSIQKVCVMEWESDQLSRAFARLIFADDQIDPVTIMLMDKLGLILAKIADHAENVGKNLRLMIIRK